MTEKEKRFKILFLLGGIAPIITMLLYLSQLIFISWKEYPASVIEWLDLFTESKLLALFYLNSLDMISIGVLGIMFLALHHVLKDTDTSLITIATPFALLGIAVFIVPRSLLLSIGPLADQYAVAASAAEKTEILAAGRALSAVGIPTINTAGFLILSFAAFLTSLVMIRSEAFFSLTGWIGIAGFVFTVFGDLSRLVLPSWSTLLLVITGFIWIFWWILLARRLILMAKECY